ncbi:MAG TPA: SMP-30/gluconolactonase/LRE family protein [Candidatus Binataceae bacterium]|jgi:sugar lactone lactonase YvrE|nr:SMP-30/gluconolactonase/LRE family protein [Candidatus Binataceae bacterium]
MEFETLATGYGLVEGPRVDDQNRLYYSDIRGGGVFRRNPDGRIETLIADRKFVGGIALNAGGGLIVSGRTLAHWDESTGKLRDLFSEWDGKPLFGINDLTTDDQGRVWFGTFGFDIHAGFDFKSKPPTGSLFRIDSSGKATKLWDGVEITNGLGFSPDRKLLYHCDSNVGVMVYDVRSDGSVSDRRLFAKLPEGSPDGMTVDAEGGVWVAVVMGPGEVVRFRPDGTLDRRVKVPAKSVTSVSFGGPDLMDFYAVTANNSNDRALKGTVFRARADIAGLPVPKARF